MMPWIALGIGDQNGLACHEDLSNKTLALAHSKAGNLHWPDRGNALQLLGLWPMQKHGTGLGMCFREKSRQGPIE
jgi:hypothetical protein